MKIKTYKPSEKLPKSIILPKQTHSTNILEIKAGEEDLSNCDGIWTRDLSKVLGIKTADCAPIAFWEEEKFGIVHAGWRGLCDGIIEKMLEIFDSPKVFVGPLLPKFQIQKDACYDKIVAKFGEEFLVGIEEEGIIVFDFKAAIQSIIPQAEFDERSTFHDLELASWRRDGDERRNVMVVGG